LAWVIASQQIDAQDDLKMETAKIEALASWINPTFYHEAKRKEKFKQVLKNAGVISDSVQSDGGEQWSEHAEATDFEDRLAAAFVSPVDTWEICAVMTIFFNLPENSP